MLFRSVKAFLWKGSSVLRSVVKSAALLLGVLGMVLPAITAAPVSASGPREAAVSGVMTAKKTSSFVCGGYSYQTVASRYFGQGKYLAVVGARGNGARAAYVLVVDSQPANIWITDVPTGNQAHVMMGPVWAVSTCLPLRSGSVAKFAAARNGVKSTPDWTLG